jgi:hypothetical protein
MHVPALGTGDALLQIAGTRGGVKVGAPRQNEGGECEGQQFLDGMAASYMAARRFELSRCPQQHLLLDAHAIGLSGPMA